MSDWLEGGVAEAPISAGRYAIWVTAALLEGDQSSLDAPWSVTVD
jgi:hypothetical protein